MNSPDASLTFTVHEQQLRAARRALIPFITIGVVITLIPITVTFFFPPWSDDTNGRLAIQTWLLFAVTPLLFLKIASHRRKQTRFLGNHLTSACSP